MEEQEIKDFKLLGRSIFSIVFDGLHDIYRLFGITICKIENDRNFWNDWE